MDAPLLAVVGVFLAALFYWHWAVAYVHDVPSVSGDSYYIRRFAFTGNPVSKPYCWRPLFPVLARVAGFRPLAYVSLAVATYAIFRLCGGGWGGAALAIGFVGNPHLVRFHITSPDYCDSLGQALFLTTLLALSTGSLAAIPLAFLCALTRENLGVTVGLLAIPFVPLAGLAALVALVLAYTTRREDHENVHPLVEKTAYETLCRWVRAKKEGATHFAHVVQPVRLLPFFVPFGWYGVNGFSHVALAGLLPLFFFALPASGQSRQLSYAYGLLAPFAAACPLPWAWVAGLLQWFWPADLGVFDEGGGITWSTIQ